VNLPNALTVLRIFLVPVLVVVLLTRARTDEGLMLGMGIFGLAVLTDYLVRKVHGDLTVGTSGGGGGR